MKFIKDCKASLSVEASIVFGIFVLFIGGVADAGYAMLSKNRLERLSYSYLELIRQSKDLKTINQDQLDKANSDALFNAAIRLSKNYIKDPESLGMIIEVFEFNKEAKPSIKDFKKYGIECALNGNINTLAVPKGKESYHDIYRVGFCFKSYLPSTKALLDLSASAVGVGK